MDYIKLEVELINNVTGWICPNAQTCVKSKCLNLRKSIYKKCLNYLKVFGKLSIYKVIDNALTPNFIQVKWAIMHRNWERTFL